MSSSQNTAIMRRSSITFFYSSLFFPRAIRDDVRTLYAFVRTADDFVDRVPQDAKGFQKFCEEYRACVDGSECSSEVVQEFVELARRRRIQRDWVDSFLWAMGQDLSKAVYTDISETLAYVYGSAETVGMMMARIMELPEESLPCARALGRAFQYINFIRDIFEDAAMGRTYLPLGELRAAGLAEVSEECVRKNPDAFNRFIRGQLKRYNDWLKEAENGYRYIPARALAAVKTAADMFNYTASVIQRRPISVLERKVKPPRILVIATGVRNFLRLTI